MNRRRLPPPPARPETHEVPETRESAPANLRSACFRLAKDLRTMLDRDLAPYGLRTQQAAVLLRCCRYEGMNPSQLAAAVGTDTAGATGLVDQLEKRGLVVRRMSASDRRVVLVEPTPAGRQLAPRLRALFQAVNEVLLAGFSREEAARLEAMLQRLRTNVQERLAETSDIHLIARRPRRAHSAAPQEAPAGGVPPPGGLEE